MRVIVDIYLLLDPLGKWTEGVSTRRAAPACCLSASRKVKVSKAWPVRAARGSCRPWIIAYDVMAAVSTAPLRSTAAPSRTASKPSTSAMSRLLAVPPSRWPNWVIVARLISASCSIPAPFDNPGRSPMRSASGRPAPSRKVNPLDSVSPACDSGCIRVGDVFRDARLAILLESIETGDAIADWIWSGKQFGPIARHPA